MMRSSYDVRIWNILANKGKRRTTYTVRWKVEGEPFRETFATLPLADSFRSALITATRQGEAFGLSDGRPDSYRTGTPELWYDFAVQFCDVQWRRTSANSRRNTAKTLTAVTMALLESMPSGVALVDVRRALREWAFNTARRESAPDGVAAILSWVRRNSVSMSVWEDVARVDDVLHALSLKLDGSAVAPSSVKRHRRVLNVAMEHSVKRRILRANPLPKGHSAAPKASSAVDKRCLLNSEQAGALLTWVWRRPRGGPRLHAFFATIYYTGARPEEAVGLRVRDVTLPAEDDDDQWGEILLHTAEPEVGKHWTDSGEVHDRRGLKGRAADDTRPVPCRPALTRILRAHIAAEQLKNGGLLFSGEHGGMLAGSVFRRAWRTARQHVLSPDQYASPLGRRVYDLRHTCLTGWLNNGVPAAQVAEWAGNSVPILLTTYARCISGQLRDLQLRIESDGDLPNPSGEG